tara:strand:+ start:275 stop:691 length:417 start_codon:yes stop_codon:yes gene_type:complete
MFAKEIVDRMENIVCLDCRNCEGGDEPWGCFDRDDNTDLYSCSLCKSKNIRFISDIRYEEEGEWVEDKYHDQICSRLDRKRYKVTYYLDDSHVSWSEKAKGSVLYNHETYLYAKNEQMVEDILDDYIITKIERKPLEE